MTQRVSVSGKRATFLCVYHSSAGTHYGQLQGKEEATVRLTLPLARHSPSSLPGLVGILCVALPAIPVLAFGHMVFAANVRDIHVGWRQFQAPLMHRISYNLRHGEIAKPLVVRGNNIPWRALGAGRCNCLLVRLHILRPQLSFGVVAFADLPMPRRILEPLREAG